MAFGTRRPEAIVWAPTCSSANALAASNARTIGWQPLAWTLNMRGRLPPIQPSSSISSNAFHMPTSPVPPPVG